MSEESKVGSEALIVVSNSILKLNIFSNIARGDWVIINYFDCFSVFKSIIRKVVLVCKSLIHKGKSSISTIHRYISINFDIMVR
jgi:hypothetical protein